MMTVTVLCAAFVVMPLLLVLGQIGLYVVDRQRIQTVIDAACLVAANDMSRIMIDDPNFGFVSLSNYPPTGAATLAPDGDPLPVTSINTLMGTLRQNSIVARQLGNRSMGVLVDSDRRALQHTVRTLNSTLTDALNSTENCKDTEGQEVDPVADVTAFLTANLPSNVELESVRLSNGWLSGGGTTTIPVPQPRRLACLQEDDYQNGNYKAFIDVPVGGSSFTFAGLGPTSSLVNSTQFQEADDEHICSIVKLECTLKVKDLPLNPAGINFGSDLATIACAQPFCLPDTATRGVMTLKFAGGTVAGLQTWNDLLTPGKFQDRQVTAYDVVGGDYPVDPDARMNERPLDSQPQTTSQLFAEHFYYWLRNGHMRPRVDAILKLVREPFHCGPNEFYAYEFLDDGSISRKLMSGNPFPVGVIADSQNSAVVDTSVDGESPIIVFRDNVKHLGTTYGGKHGGQPLAGYPLDWSDLEENSGDQQLASRLSRRSLYRRGLALDIEVGIVSQNVPAASPATMVPESKAGILRSRKI